MVGAKEWVEPSARDPDASMAPDPPRCRDTRSCTSHYVMEGTTSVLLFGDGHKPSLQVDDNYYTTTMITHL